MLTIKNIDTIKGAVPKDWEVKAIIEDTKTYAFILEKTHMLYNPMTFTPTAKVSMRTIELEREINPKSLTYKLKETASGYFQMVDKNDLKNPYKLLNAMECLL